MERKVTKDNDPHLLLKLGELLFALGPIGVNLLGSFGPSVL
jgi:hypothetical protein